MLRMLALISSILYLVLSNTTVYAVSFESKLNNLSNSNMDNKYTSTVGISNNTAAFAYSEASSLITDENDSGIILLVLIAAFFFIGLLFGIIFGLFLENYNKKNNLAEKKYHNYYKDTESCYRKPRTNWSSFDKDKNPDIIKYEKTE